MKLSPDTLANKRPQQFPVQEELPHMPPPMTANRAKDIRKPCNRCEAASCPCTGWEAFEGR